MIRPIKSLGQHFLNDDSIAERIADSLIIEEGKNKVIEVGPGEGMLTRFLLDRGDLDLRVVELDRRLPERLQKKFPELKGRVIHADILKVDFNQHFDEPFSLIGNFPYNISSQILFKVLENRNLVRQMVGMFQKEVAERIAGHPSTKAYGILSVLAQAYYDVELLFEVDKSKFTPPPRVQSAVIRMVRNEQYEDQVERKKLFSVVKQAFHLRRKKLSNALKGRKFSEEVLDSGILHKRAEALSVEDFIWLTNEIG